MSEKYYVDSSKVYEMQTVFIRKKEERIILIGTQQHKPINNLKSFICMKFGWQTNMRLKEKFFILKEHDKTWKQKL